MGLSQDGMQNVTKNLAVLEMYGKKAHCGGVQGADLSSLGNEWKLYAKGRTYCTSTMCSIL